MAGNLFTDYFLTDGIKATSEWRTSVAAAAQFDTFRNGVRQRYDTLTHSQDPNEAVTEQELIRPVLELLGWTDYLPQQGASRNEDIPDLLLFPDADTKERAIARASTEGATATPLWWKRANGSACPWTPAAGMAGARPRRPMIR